LLVRSTAWHFALRWTPLSRPKSDDSSLLSHQALVIPPSRRP
jgi:hypothetical protein